MAIATGSKGSGVVSSFGLLVLVVDVRRHGREVGGELGVVEDAVAQGLGHAVDLVQEHAGVRRSLGAVAAVARATSASTYAGMSGRTADGAGTSSWTWR